MIKEMTEISNSVKTSQDIDQYLNTVIKESLFANQSRLRFHMDTLFAGIDLKNKKVLDIGGGAGLYSFYAAFRGAKKVVCLEPEADGSKSGVNEKFHKIKQHLECINVELLPIPLQALESEEETFDVILLHNSINHLDEAACINLLWESESRSIYQYIASKIYSVSNNGAILIICDCSRYNFLDRKSVV